MSALAKQPDASPLQPGDEVTHETFGPATVERAGSFTSLIVTVGGTKEIVANSGLKVVKLKAANDNTRAADTFPLVNPAQWHGQPIPPRQWFIEDLIPMGQVTLLSGDGGVGKSLLALQLAAAAAMSLDTLNLEPWAGRALYVGAEDDQDEFLRRLADITKAHGKDLDHLLLLRLVPLAERDALLSVPNKSGTMEPTPLWRGIASFAAEFTPRLIVLDTSADLFGGDEIKRAQVRQFIAMLRKLAIELQCAIVLLSHPSVQGMQTGTGISGSTGWSNSVRSRLYLTRDKDDADLRILKVMKSNYGEAGKELRLRWKDGAFVLDDGKPNVGSMLLAAKADRVFIETLAKLFQQGQKLSPSPSATYAPKLIAAHPDGAGISKKELVAAQQRLLDARRIRIVEDGPASRRTRHLVVSESEISD
ncbi:AAA family ATPase [Rhizobium helianthi]|uniref:AAA family ATPase n=1 Tax=Rhizobium helianthi TaxID=1132695 RepID=A0ABW4LY13_9HYPH